MPVSRTDIVLAALQTFAREVKRATDLGSRIHAGPEDQLKRTVPALVEQVGKTLGRHVSVLSESPVHEVGRGRISLSPSMGSWWGTSSLKRRAKARRAASSPGTT